MRARNQNVIRLPKDPGPAAWNAILSDADHYSPLQADAGSEWLVIGAGFAGLAAARRLSQLHPGDRVSVLEASRIAEGPAGRNSGFMIDVPHDLASGDYSGKLDRDRRDIRLNRAGISFALDAQREYGLPEEAIVQSGKVNAAITGRGVLHNAAYARHLESLDEPFERLDANAMRSLTGTECYIDGLYSPGTAMLQPALYTRGVAAGLHRTGVRLYEHSPVISLNRQGASWVARTPSGSVVAPKVVLAVNGHAESFGYFRHRLVHIFTYASMTRAMSRTDISRVGGQANWGLTSADPLGTTVRRISGTGGDRIIIRNRATFDPSMEVSHSRLSRIARDHDRAFAARFPMLDKLAMEFRWGGRLCLSRNNAAAFGEVEPGLYAACCQNGLGTAKGTVSGMLAAELASSVDSSLLDDMHACAGPVRLPPAPLAWLGATTMLRWGEYRAGREL